MMEAEAEVSVEIQKEEEVEVMKGDLESHRGQVEDEVDPWEVAQQEEEEIAQHSEYHQPHNQWQNYDFEKDIPVDKLREHIQFLLQNADPNDPSYTGFDEEFNYIENQTAQEQFFGDYKSAMLPTNKNKNRYSNVLPPERTRVRLTSIPPPPPPAVEEGKEQREEEEEPDSSYINANFIDGLVPSRQREYIATQGPLQSTLPEFWRMIWELNVSVIVMLTKEVENGRLKCDKYWPEDDCPLTMGPFKVSILNLEETSTDELTTRTLQILNLDSGESRQVTQLQYTAWPDHGLPVSTTAFLELTHFADEANKTKGPIVVHCSAGIGRSGTFCTVHSTIEKLKLEMKERPNEQPVFNIVKTVLFMRSQRPGMVQTKEQYMFLYLAILEETERLFALRESSLTE